MGSPLRLNASRQLSAIFPLGQMGVKVTILQLGGFATPYAKKALDPATRVPAYEPVVTEMLTGIRTLADNPDATPPSAFAEVVQRLAAMPQPPLRVPFGLGAREYLDLHLTARRQAFDETVI